MNEFGENFENEQNNSNDNPIKEQTQPMFERSASGNYSYDGRNSIENEPKHTDLFFNNSFFDIEEFKEKQSVRKYANTLGLTLCIYSVGGVILARLIQRFMISALGLDKMINILTDPNAVYILSSVVSIILMTVPFILMAKVLRHDLNDLIVYSNVGKSKIAALTMLGIGTCTLSNYATAIFASFLKNGFGVEVQSSMVEYNTGLESFLLMLLCVGILPAVLEEFAMRGVVLGILRKKFSDATAILISAALFGLIHGNLQQIPFAFGVGLVLGYATVYSNSLLPAVIIHAFNNSMSVALSFASNTASPLISSVISILYYIVTLLIGICGFIILIKGDKNALKLSNKSGENTTKKFKWFCTAPFMVAFFVLCGLEILYVQGIIK